VHDADRADLVLPVFGQARFDLRRIDAAAPVVADELGLEAELFGDLLPQRG
jgi:hypothetical protein